MSESTLMVGGLEIGAGKPKIIVPLTASNRAELLAQARQLADQPVDLVEWRADYYADVENTAALLGTMAELRDSLAGYPLLFTLRTQAEGGAQALTPSAYAALNRAVAASGLADLLDVELRLGESLLRPLIGEIQSTGTLVLCSSHDFQATPQQSELVQRLRKMQELGADILKIAVMPTCAADILTLFAATLEMREKYAQRPLVTIAMGEIGLISRLSGELFGSCLSFGTVGTASAPGQIPAAELDSVLTILHRALHKSS